MYQDKKTYRINKKMILKRVIQISIVLIVIIFSITIFKYINKVMEDKKLKITEKSAFPEEVYGVKVINDILEETSIRRPATKRLIKYIVIHETGNSDRGADAKMHSSYIKNNSELSTSWHYTVDNKEIYHHVPDNEIAYHAGDGTGPGNTNGIGVELCINKDGDFDKTFKNATKLVAYLLKEYKLTINDIKIHGDFINKHCPHNILKNNRLGEFKNEVKKLI